jgi:hypothetical protein
MSMKNSNDTIGNGTRDLPICSAVPQPTAPPAVCFQCSGIPLNIQKWVENTCCISTGGEGGLQNFIPYPLSSFRLTLQYLSPFLPKSICITLRHNSQLYYIFVLQLSQFKTQLQPVLSSCVKQVSMKISTFNWIIQPDAANSQVYYLSFRYSSTCFGQPHAHHQELQQLQ